jgi:hypothetical protein
MFDAVPVVMTRRNQPFGPAVPPGIVSEAVGVIGTGVVPVDTTDWGDRSVIRRSLLANSDTEIRRMTDGDLVRAGRTLVNVSDIETYDDEAVETTPARWFDIRHWFGRLLWCVLAGTIVNITTGIHALGVVVTVMLYVIVTVIIMVSYRD